MARFESPCQIVSLFLTAGVVAVLLIVLLNAEARHREHTETFPENDDGVGITVTSGLKGAMRKVIKMFSSSDASELEPTSSDEDNKRRKREVDVDYFYSEEEDQTTSDLSILHSPEDDNSLRLSEALLTSAARGHKVRNIKQKIQDIGQGSQLVQSVLALYCAHRESVNYFLCYNTDNSTQTNSSQIENSTQVKEKNTEKIDKGDYHKNLTDYVNVMSVRLSPPTTGESLGICNYHDTILITIVITTLANFICFLFLLTLCRKSSKTEDESSIHLT